MNHNKRALDAIIAASFLDLVFWSYHIHEVHPGCDVAVGWLVGGVCVGFMAAVMRFIMEIGPVEPPP